MVMLRPEYWNKAKELLEWCNDTELKILSQQSEKALTRMMSKYLRKLEREDKGKKAAKQRAIKKKMRLKSIGEK